MYSKETVHLPSRPKAAAERSSYQYLAASSCNNDLQMSRSVPEVDFSGAQHMTTGHGTYAMGCSMEPHQQNPAQNPYMDPSSLFTSSGCSYSKAEEPVHHQEPVVGACGTNTQDGPPPMTILHGIENSLRHKINLQIEDFRFGLQQTLTDEFDDYCSTLLPPEAKCRKCGSGMDSRHHHQPWSHVDELEAYQSLPGDGSLSGRGEGGSVVDLGACSTSTDSRESETLDQLIDKELIKLQTQAALITSTLLSRPEYVITRHQDLPQNAEPTSALSDSD